MTLRGKADLIHDMNNDATYARKKLGRKPIPFAFPQGEFSAKSLAAGLKISLALVYRHINGAGDKLKRVRVARPDTNSRGRGIQIFEYKH